MVLFVLISQNKLVKKYIAYFFNSFKFGGGSEKISEYKTLTDFDTGLRLEDIKLE